MPRPPVVPSYRHHKPSGQAVVTIAGQDCCLGAFGSPASHRAYQRLIKQWLATGQVRQADPPPLSVDDLMARFWIHAEAYYQRDGHPTGELDNIRYALRPLHQLFGDYPASKFGPKDLKLVQQEMITQGLCRNVINRRVCKIKRVFKWAVSKALLPVRVYAALPFVAGF